MTTTTKIIREVSTIKERVETLDKGGRLFYEIWAYIPTSSSEPQLFGKGNNKLEKIYDQFEREFDNILNNAGVVKIQIKLKDSRKDFGTMELVIREAYESSLPIVRPLQTDLKVQNFPENEPSKFQNANFMTMLGQAFLGASGLSGINDETGGLGTILAIQEKVISDKHENQKREEKLHNYIEENATLKSQIKDRDTEITNLTKQLEDSEDRVFELETELQEYEKLNPQRNMISGIGQQILSGIAVNLVKQSKYAGLLGLDDVQPTAPQNFGNQANVQFSETNENTDEIVEFANSLDTAQQVEFQQLVKIFKEDSNLIKACLCYIIGDRR